MEWNRLEIAGLRVLPVCNDNYSFVNLGSVVYICICIDL